MNSHDLLNQDIQELKRHAAATNKALQLCSDVFAVLIKNVETLETVVASLTERVDNEIQRVKALEPIVADLVKIQKAKRELVRLTAPFNESVLKLLTQDEKGIDGAENAQNGGDR